MIKIIDSVTENYQCTQCGDDFFSEGPCPRCTMDPMDLCTICEELEHEENSMFCVECNKMPKSYCAVCYMEMPYETAVTPIFCSSHCEDQVHDKKKMREVLTHIQTLKEYKPDIKNGHDWTTFRIWYATAFDDHYNGDVAWDEHLNFVSCVWRSSEGILYELYRDGRTWIDMLRDGETPFDFESEGDWWEYVTQEGQRKYEEQKEKKDV